MKILLKILFAPHMAVTWAVIKSGAAITYVSGLVMGVVSKIIVLISIVYIFTGDKVNGLTGLAISYLLSPYGIPTFTAMLLGLIGKFRENIKSRVYA